MKYKIGQYTYFRRGNVFRIFRCSSVSANGAAFDLVKEENDYAQAQDARRRIYELNGWRWRQ